MQYENNPTNAFRDIAKNLQIFIEVNNGHKIEGKQIGHTLQKAHLNHVSVVRDVCGNMKKII